MIAGQQMSEQDYEALVLSGVEGVWELHDGRLVEKPALSGSRGTIISRLARQLVAQVDAVDYQVRINDWRVRAPGETILIPDLAVVATASGSPDAGQRLPIIHVDAVPLIVEVWLPRSDGYDVDTKFRIYQQRGDLEIWRIHPADRTLTTWVRQRDGTYTETIYQPGAGWPLARFGVPPGQDPRYHA